MDARNLNSHPALMDQAEKCRTLLTEIDAANSRIILCGRAGSFPWKQMLADTYNRVCQLRDQRRLGTAPPDPYLDAIGADPDVATVCDQKWKLGETLELYRQELTAVFPVPKDHRDLELHIRRSVTQPNLSPEELETALRQTLAFARTIGDPAKPPIPTWRPAAHPHTLSLSQVHIRAGTPVLLVTLIFSGLFGFLSIYGGIQLMAATGSGETAFNFIGLHFTTKQAGVASIGLGAIVIILTFRRVLKSLELLGKL